MNSNTRQQNSNARYTKRIKIIAWLNFVFALLQIAHTYGASSRGYIWQGLVFFASVIGLVLGGYFLLKGKTIGKTLTRFSGLLGILLLVYFTGRLVPDFFNPMFTFEDVWQSITYAFWLYFFRVFYPILAGFIFLNKPNEDLGLS
jgi:hypothetical protein